MNADGPIRHFIPPPGCPPTVAPPRSGRSHGNIRTRRRQSLAVPECQFGLVSAAKSACAPLVAGGEIVDAEWRRLLDRAGPRQLPPLTDHLISLSAETVRPELVAPDN